MLAFRTKINASRWAFLFLAALAFAAMPGCKPEEKDKCKDKKSSSSSASKNDDKSKDKDDGKDDDDKCDKGDDGDQGGTTPPTTPAPPSYQFPANPGRECVVDTFQQSGQDEVIKKVDLLFVMDHSGSMADDWGRVANNIHHLVKELPSDHNIRFAVLLADGSSWKGKLYSPNSSIPKVLDNQKMRVQDIANNLHKMFTEGMKVNDQVGSGEASFLSLHSAVTANIKDNQKLGFFRPDAALSVLFMSDEQEIGFPFPKVQAPGLPPRCDADVEDRIKAEQYDAKGINMNVALNAVKKVKGDMPVLMNAFVNITKEDLFKRNNKNAKCLYDSLGYGYFDIVAKQKGILFSLQEDKAEGLSRCGRAIRESVELVHNFPLSRPADQVDVATILAAVDGKKVAHEYTAINSSVYLANAGVHGSKIEIQHCKPVARQEWTLQNFGGQAGQYDASVSWNTPEVATNDKLLYGTSPTNLANQLVGSAATTNHSFSITGLNPNTVYYFQGVSTDDYGLEKRSVVISLRTKPDWNIQSLNGQASRFSVGISWKTPEYATMGKVRYAKVGNGLNLETALDSTTKDHNIVISGLEANTDYEFQAVSKDEFGLEKASAVGTFHTITDWAIVGFANTAARNSVALQWQTPDYATQSSVIWGTAANALTNVAPLAGTNTTHAANIAGLNSNTVYYFQGISRDDLGVERRTEVVAVRTLREWELTGFIGDSTETTVTLSWNTTGYGTNGKVVWGATPEALSNVVLSAANGESHSVTVGGLSSDTVYYFQAISSDALGLTKASEVVAIRTKAVVVVPPPLPSWEITGFAGVATLTSVTMNWNTDAYATTAKLLWGTSSNALTNVVNKAGSATSHSVLVEGLTADTIYYFQAVNTDDKGQEKSSAVVAVRTLAPAPNPDPTPDPTPIPAWNIFGFDATTSATGANVIWQTPGVPTKATVLIGLTATEFNVQQIDVPTSAATHVITVTGLTPNTTYFIKVIASDASGRTQESVVITKKTKVQ